MKMDTIDEYNHEINETRQTLDELITAAELTANLLGTVSLVRSTISALPLGHVNGQTILKSNCLGPSYDLHENILTLHSRISDEIRHYQVNLNNLIGGDEEMSVSWGGDE